MREILGISSTLPLFSDTCLDWKAKSLHAVQREAGIIADGYSQRDGVSGAHGDKYGAAGVKVLAVRWAE